MSVNDASITLYEWETIKPTECVSLADRCLDSSPAAQRAVSVLNESRMLALTELRHGLEVKAFSHVGKVRLGDLTITVLPKLPSPSLLTLARYAFGFRRLKQIGDSAYAMERYGFEDLLIMQLTLEAQELISRGLLRAYVTTSERLSVLRGKVDIKRMAFDCGTLTTTLPCQHHPRIEDTLLNQVLMAGLHLASVMTDAVDLRRKSRRLISLLEEQVSSVRMDGAVLDRAVRGMNRLTTAYTSALAIIRLLFEAQGVVLNGQPDATRLPGFMFDMNAFFQALLSRFLRENLPGFVVRDEHGLRGMIRYNPKYNPQRRHSPTPRPDYVVTRQGKVCAILDAKYRDLWQTQLPREMLYQLVVYAISHREMLQSSILYPTTDARAAEARIDVSDPLFGKHLGQVCLRPVLFSEIESLIRDTSEAGRRQRAAYAYQLAFGQSG